MGYTYPAGRIGINLYLVIKEKNMKTGLTYILMTSLAIAGHNLCLQAGTLPLWKTEPAKHDTVKPKKSVVTDTIVQYPGYRLSWSDEFNGNSLNMKDWSFDNGNGCPSNCGWGNNELEFYTDRPTNLFFKDGNLVIEARKEDYKGKPYTSAKIITRDKKAFLFGRIDIRAKLPKGKGIWPAFWMMPQENKYGGWPTSGEIDMMEMIGHEANKTYGTLHFGPGPGSTQLGGNTSLSSGIFNDDFHLFSLEWKKDEISWYLDGKLFSKHTRAETGNATYPFNESFYFIINLAVGGNWPGNPDETTILPQQLIVDYIRLYQ
jgi:beta-glucanase (GH16 family)